MKYTDIVKAIELIAPPSLAEEWDNCGTQVFTGQEDVSGALVCLEVTDEVIVEAINKDIHMIISHHPLIFGGISSVDIAAYGREAVTGRYIAKLIDNDICVYSAHTSFDSSPSGNNVYLARLLGLSDVEGPSDKLMGCIGHFEKEISFLEARAHVASVLNIREEHLRVVADPEKMIKTVALCTGAGGGFLEDAVGYGCDLMITGDVKFDQAQYAKASGIALIDAGHFGTEKIFAENFAAQLRVLTPELNVVESVINSNPYLID